VQAASLEPVKNQHLLLQVLALARREMPALRLRLAGEGRLEGELKAEARRLGVYEQVIWHGKVPFLQMPAIYQQSHLYVQTSWHEAQGMSVVEGLATGLPVVGTPVGVLPQMAALPPVWSAEGLAGQVVEILGKRELWAEKCRQARQMAVDHFSLSIIQDNFEKIYRNSLST
jgi:glycosyltransferase involved in cell wall biosynthesis